MNFLLKRVIVFSGFFFMAISFFCQSIELVDADNKAQGYAIEAAQKAQKVYMLTQTYYLKNELNELKLKKDSLIYLTKQAVTDSEKAINYASESDFLAIETISSANMNLHRVLDLTKSMLGIRDKDRLRIEIQKLIYESQNACVKAYKASLYFTIKDSLTSDTAIIENKVEKQRSFTRLELDEYSYLSVKQIYQQRVIEIDTELKSLSEQVKLENSKTPKELNEIINQLKNEKHRCLEKIENSNDKLISVRNDLNEEMLKVVSKDVFRVDKIKFYSSNVPIPVTDQVPNGLVYKLQVGFFESNIPADHFEGLFPLSTSKVDETYFRYVVGNFKRYKEAEKAKKMLVERGYSDSFIISFLDGNKIPISTALREEAK